MKAKAIYCIYKELNNQEAFIPFPWKDTCYEGYHCCKWFLPSGFIILSDIPGISKQMKNNPFFCIWVHLSVTSKSSWGVRTGPQEYERILNHQTLYLLRSKSNFQRVTFQGPVDEWQLNFLKQFIFLQKNNVSRLFWFLLVFWKREEDTAPHLLGMLILLSVLGFRPPDYPKMYRLPHSF